MMHEQREDVGLLCVHGVECRKRQGEDADADADADAGREMF